MATIKYPYIALDDFQDQPMGPAAQPEPLPEPRPAPGAASSPASGPAPTIGNLPEPLRPRRLTPGMRIWVQQMLDQDLPGRTIVMRSKVHPGTIHTAIYRGYLRNSRSGFGMHSEPTTEALLPDKPYSLAPESRVDRPANPDPNTEHYPRPSGFYKGRQAPIMTPEVIDRAKKLIAGGATMGDLSSSLGIHPTTIQRQVRAGNLPPPQTTVLKTPETIAKANELFRQGLTITEVARQLGIKPVTVTAWRQRGLVHPQKPELERYGQETIAKVQKLMEQGLGQHRISRELGIPHGSTYRLMQRAQAHAARLAAQQAAQNTVGEGMSNEYPGFELLTPSTSRSASRSWAAGFRRGFRRGCGDPRPAVGMSNGRREYAGFELLVPSSWRTSPKIGEGTIPTS